MKKLIYANLLCCLFTLNSFCQDGKFTFTIPSAIRTSAGVFKDDSILIRTIWNNVDYAAGTYTSYWDGKDDEGVTVTAARTHFSVKLLSNNVNYEWQGVLGNTSQSQTGSGVHRGYYHCMQGLVFTNGYGYYCKGYAEGNPSLSKFLITNPQTKIDFVTSKQPGYINYVATDGINVYWGAFDANANTNTFVFASRVSDDADYSFSKGKSYTVTYGKTYSKVVSSLNQANSYITGLAVQKNGPHLFVARAALNQVQVLDKTTGELKKTLSFTTPKSMCVDKAGNLWMVTNINTVSKYSVNSDGSLSAPTLSLTGLLKPAALQVSPDGTSISVADDSTSQQVKFFSNSTGTATYILGTPGGYIPDPNVNNDKFYFNDLRNSLLTFIAYQPDGSFWVGDAGNYRAQHYSSGRTYINTIQSLGASYNTGVDKNDITRVFSDNLEFSVDYATQTLSGSAGWKLVKNWGANIPATNYHKDPMYQTTLSNGRTYGLIRNLYSYEVVEYPATGPLRFTGTKMTETTKILCDDGSLQDCTITGNNCVIKRYVLTGFDGMNNPQWSTTPEILATTTTSSTVGNPACFPETQVLTSTNKVVFYNHKAWANNKGPVYSSGFHLGMMNRGGSSWLFQTEKSTYEDYAGEFPPPGFFDVGNMVNDYAGGHVNVVDRNIITSYHGEFWKNGQTNKFNHYWDNGLALGQFGTTRAQTIGVSAPMMAGNALTPTVVRDGNGNYYLYHGDEADHAGIHRWKITGLNTIKEETLQLASPTAYKGIVGYVDLMKGLPFNEIMPNNVAGWTRNPASNAVADKFTNAFTAFTGRLKFDRTTSPDVFLNFVKKTKEDYSVSRDLGSNNVTNSWKISGELAYPGNMPNGNTIEQYLEVLDNQGKILTRFYPELDRAKTPFTAYIYGNNAKIAQGTEANIRSAMDGLHPFEVKIINGVLTFTYSDYAPVTTSLYDSKANWRTPKTLRVVFISDKQTTLGVYQTIIDLKDFKFYKDFLPASGNLSPVANAGNDKLVTLPLANNSTLAGSAKDADGTIRNYSWLKVSGPAGGNISASTSPTTDVNGLGEGVYRYQLKVTDDDGAIAIDTAQITVLKLNEPPVANAGGDISITVPTLSATLRGTGTDPDGSIVRYKWVKVSGPSTYLIGSPDAATTVVSLMVPGVYEYSLTVTDNDGEVATNTVKVTVNIALSNRQPVANAGPDKTMTLPTNSTTLNGSGSDPDGTIRSYAWAKISGPALGIIASPYTATTIIYNLAKGVYQFELTVTDNGYAVKKDIIEVTVNAGSTNQLPTVNGGPDKFVIVPWNVTSVAGSGQDIDGNISFLWSKVSGPSTYYINTPNSPSSLLTNLVEGVYVFELKVTDNNGASVKDYVTVTVYVTGAPANKAPVANAGSDKTIDLPTNSITLAGGGMDSDGNISSYSWVKTSGPGTYNIISPWAAVTTIENLVEGTYQFQLTVTDNDGSAGSDYIEITVDPGSGFANRAPQASAGPDQVISLPTTSTSLSGSGTDPDGTISSYSWSKISGPGTSSIVSPFSAATGVINLQQGAHKFQLKVTDNNGATHQDDVSVTVNAGSINKLPTADAGPDRTITLPTKKLKVTGTANDPDGTIKTYLWSKFSGPASYSISSADKATATFDGLGEGSYNFVFTVTDNDGDQARDTFKIKVNRAAAPPPPAPAPPAANTSVNRVPVLPQPPIDIKQVKVYPNPVKDIARLNITSINQTGKIAVSVINTFGTRIIYKETVMMKGATPFLDLSGLANGIYIISVRFDDGTIISNKVIKEGTIIR